MAPKSRTARRTTQEIKPCGIPPNAWLWQSSDAPPIEGKFQQIVVVLGKMLQLDGSPEPMLVERMAFACSLWHQLRSTARTALLLSGGNVQQSIQTEAECMQQMATTLHSVPETSIIRDSTSMNTTENAINSLRLAKEHAAETVKIFVVTSNFHLPRTRLYFQNVAHQTGCKQQITFLAAPFSGPELVEELKAEDKMLAKKVPLCQLPFSPHHWFLRLASPGDFDPVRLHGVSLIYSPPVAETIRLAEQWSPRVIVLPELAEQNYNVVSLKAQHADMSLLTGNPVFGIEGSNSHARVAALIERVWATPRSEQLVVFAPNSVLETLAGGHLFAPGECRVILWAPA
eukprot:TRINITY_DN7120_c0_g1_i1.p1 TRINITY_DN7120_c0_g1~~TRINITY_DN7120_c0_g1_i1.p1  ORF type:complete len:351 (-),score=52.62 TRINITY_DN7120_c0_g1_i1:11-1042(-)